MASWLVVFQGRYLAREEVLSVATRGFIGCYGHVRRTNMESPGEVKLRGTSRHPSLALPFSGLTFSHHSWFLWLWLDARAGL